MWLVAATLVPSSTHARDILHTLAHVIGKRPQTCAVVGSSGSLLFERQGSAIDSHDLVMRFNNAPVAGFSPIVGATTSVRVLNSHAIADVLQRCANFASNGQCAANASCCMPEPTLLNSGRENLVECFRRVCARPSAPNLKTLLQNTTIVQAFEKSLSSSLWRLRKSLMSGA